MSPAGEGVDRAEALEDLALIDCLIAIGLEALLSRLEHDLDGFEKPARSALAVRVD